MFNTKLLLSTIVFILILPIHSNTKKTTDLITRACAHTPDHNLCQSTLRTAPNGTDLRGLTVTALNVARVNANSVSEHIAGLLKTATNSYMKQCLVECSDNYQDAMDQIEDSIAALDTRGYDDILAWIASAMNDADSIVIATSNLLVEGEE